ncbi:MAG: alanine--tRNA ligase [Planctomycetes bacterium]|nr:alanine--tRNA ligase [Planctomycetota bacterium]
MKTDELREKYLTFFQSKGHTRRASDVLVPTWDDSVLFTPAGMNQFKPHFLGKVKLEFTRATTCQKCLRTGDIENVGRTAYHHTFFEMLGNFSFGDYFKREAIHWAWEFLTDKKWLGIDPKRLSVSVYLDDDEAAAIWANEIKLPSSRIERLGESENFWPASAPSEGPDGVCGPCSEIFFHGDDGKSVEIWNLVFTQFNRVGEPPDNLRPLPSKNIDTGMGLERTAAVLQGVETNYHIDILRPIVEAAAEVCGVKYEPQSDNGRRLRRITDHVRACTFAIHENVIPGPKEERYVIKRLLRRAVLDGHQMGLHEPFLHKLVPAVVAAMHSPYPELSETTQRVARVIQQEEANFFGTIDAGLARIEQIFQSLTHEHRNVVDGAEAAALYQTYGVPAELLASMAAERNLVFDWDSYRAAMEKHGEVSGTERGVLFGTGPIEAIKRAVHLTTFLGYESTEATAEIKGIIAQGQLCDRLQEIGHDKAVQVILDRSPFYGESGGQVGDSGEIVGPGFRFVVTDTQKDDDLLVHHGHLAEGVMTTGSKVTARVDMARRQAIRRAHSATHLLHHALRSTLGGHAQQQGSKVDADWLRFDFANSTAVSHEQLGKIERDVAARIREAAPVSAKTLPLTEAREAGAMMLFGEKYPDPVRMISMGDFSRELCGGIHLSSTAEVEDFEIVSEESVAAGTRRIVALTGEGARQHAQEVQDTVAQSAKLLGIRPQQLPEAAAALSRQVRDLKKQVSGSDKAASLLALKDVPAADFEGERELLQATAATLRVAPREVAGRLASLLDEIKTLQEQAATRATAAVVSADDLLASAEKVGDVRIVVANVGDIGANPMRQLIDQLRRKAAPIAVMLGGAAEDKVTLVAGISQDLEAAGSDAGRWIRESATIVGGSGGGKPSLAQAGGKHPERLEEALEAGRKFARAMVD